MARFKEVELKRQGCVSLVSRMYPDDTLFDYVVYVNISLLLPYTRYDQIKFDLVRNKILEQFPELLMPENCLEKLPDYGKTEDYIASIEVAYPATWTVEYLTKAKSGTNTNSDERKD